MSKNRLPRQPLKTLPKRIIRSYWAVAKLLYFNPAYLFLATAVSIVFYEIVFWFLNIGLFHYLLTTPFLTLGDKLQVLIGSYAGIFSLPLIPMSVTLFIVSILQGSAVAAIVYVIKKQRAIDRSVAKELGSTGLAGLLSVLGLGCVPCGTSLVTPILTLFFASSSVAIAEKVGLYSAVFALVITTVTVYFTGRQLGNSRK